MGPPIVYPYRVWGLPLYPAPSPFPYGMPGYAATYSMQTVQEGFLQLHTEPVDAAVTIDGMRIGGLWEQGQQFPVRAGMHTVEASREGFRTRVEKVQVGPGQIAPVWLTLIRGPEPTPLGESEDRGELVRPSRVPSAEAVAASSPAEPAEEGTGSLKLSVRKSRGQVFIDGQPKGDVGSDGKLLTLPVGDHAVRVDYPTGRPSLLNVRIRKNQTSEIVVP